MRPTSSVLEARVTFVVHESSHVNHGLHVDHGRRCSEHLVVKVYASRVQTQDVAKEGIPAETKKDRCREGV